MTDDGDVADLLGRERHAASVLLRWGDGAPES
jgi:hypothetical protein